MSIVKAYYYLFYKLYKVAMTGAIKSLSGFYASAGLLALEIWFLFSLYNYYAVYFNRYASLELNSVKVIVPLIVLVAINYFTISYRDIGKKHIEEFEQWPKKRNTIGSIIVSAIVLLVIGSLVFSFYLMSKVDWKQYR